MSDEFHVIDHPVVGSVPTADEVVTRRQRRRRPLGLALAALALVVGGTAGGIVLGHQGGGEHGPGFSTVTSQAFTGGQEEPNDPEPASRPATTTHAGQAGEAD